MASLFYHPTKLALAPNRRERKWKQHGNCSNTRHDTSSVRHAVVYIRFTYYAISFG